MSAATLPAGTRLGKYTIGDLLGAGGMGAVYHARDERGGVFALKVMRQDGDDALLRRFEREARAAALVDHPNVCKVVESGEERATPYLVLEYVAGGSVKALLRTRGRLSWRDAAALGAQIARGLGAIHAAGLTHRDLKPENVLLETGERGASRLGRAKVTDFGLVRGDAASALSRGTLTKTGEMLGTLEYMAPEQMDEARKVDARADLYALGGTLYCLLVGEPPFRGVGFELVKKHLRDRPRPPRELVPDVPPALEALVLRLLAKKPDERPQRADLVARELEALAGSGASGGKPGKVKLALALAALALALAAGGGVYLVATGEPAPPSPPTPPPAPASQAPSSAANAPDLPAICRGFLRSEDGKIRLAGIFGGYDWKTATSATAVAVSPEGTLGAAGDGFGGIHVVALPSGKSLASWWGHKGSVAALAFSNDSRRLLSSGEDKTIVIWDLSANVVRRLPSGAAPIVAASFTRHGKYVFAADAAGGLQLVEAETGYVLATPKTNVPLRDAAILPDGKYALLLPVKGPIRPVAVETGEGAGTEFLGKEVPEAKFARLAVSPDGTRIVAVCERGGASLWGLPSSEQVPLPAEVTGKPWWCAAFFPDSKRVLVGSAEHGQAHLAVLDAESGKLKTSWATEQRHGSFLALAVTPDGRHAFTSQEKHTGYFELGTGTNQAAILEPRGGISALAASQDGKLALAGSEDGWDIGTTRLLSLPALKEATAFRLSQEWVRGAGFSADGKRGLAAGSDNTLKVLDVAARRVERVIKTSHQPRILSAAISPDGKLAVSGGEDGTVALWSVETGENVWRDDGAHAGWVFALAFSPDGKRFLSGAAEGNLKLWDVERKAPSSTLVPGRGVLAACFVGASKALLGLDGGGIELWDLAAGGQAGGFEGHTASIEHNGLALSPDGKRALSSSTDGTVRLWDMESGKELGHLDLASSADRPYAVAFPDDRSFLVGTRRGVVLRFELSP